MKGGIKEGSEEVERSIKGCRTTEETYARSAGCRQAMMANPNRPMLMNINMGRGSPREMALPAARM